MAVYSATSLTVTKDGDTYQFMPAVSQIYYGTCSSSASNQEKEITVSGLSVLVAGLRLTVKFDNAQTYNGKPTLKIGSLGAIAVYNGYRYMWNAGEVVDFVYDGTRFYATNIGTATTTYYGLTKLVNGVTSTSTALAATGNSVKLAYDAAVFEMTGATASVAGAAGRVPAPSAGDHDKILSGAGTWITLPESGIVYIVDMGSVSSLPVTKSVSGVTTDMVCIRADISDPAVQASPWSVSTNTADSITLSGEITGSTTVKLYLQKSRAL